MLCGDMRRQNGRLADPVQGCQQLFFAAQPAALHAHAHDEHNAIGTHASSLVSL
jgi:hypothetical protein